MAQDLKPLRWQEQGIFDEIFDVALALKPLRL